LGGEAGACLAEQLQQATSPDMLLRLVRGAPETARATPRVLGIDDWALRKGQTYGTLLVDPETAQGVELLPDRGPESVAAWLREHPGVEIVTRDRASAYAEGIRQGAPDATQVADRFHLMQNLHAATESLLDRHQTVLRQVQVERTPPPVVTVEAPP